MVWTKGGISLKTIVAFFASFLTFIMIMTPSTYAKAEDFYVYANGFALEYPNHQPYSYRNQIYLPLRDTLEQLNYSVSYDRSKNTFAIEQNRVIVALLQKKDLAEKSGTTYMKARALADLLGYSLDWNQNTRRLSLSNDGILYRTARDPLPILMYHHFHEELDTTTVVAPSKFEKQLQTLQENGYMTLSSQEAYNYLKGKQIFPEKPVYITFDDGYESNYSEAFPLLQKYNSKAAIFAVTSQLREDANRNYGQYMLKLSWNQVTELAESGLVDIHSHTHDMHHKSTVQGKSTEQGMIAGPILIDGKYETKDQYAARVTADLDLSKELLEKLTGQDPFVFCYPFGSYSSSSEQLLKKAGFLMSITTKTGINKLLKHENDTFGLMRVNITNEDIGEALIDKITEKTR